MNMAHHAPIFRQATHDDLPNIIRLLADDKLGKIREDPSHPPHQKYRDAMAVIDNDRNQLLAVTEVDNEVIGCLQITFIPGLSRLGMWRGQIEGVRIARSYRSSGIGRAFLSWAIERCREKGCGLIQLTTDKTRSDAHRFYEALGFEITHDGMKLIL